MPIELHELVLDRIYDIEEHAMCLQSSLRVPSMSISSTFVSIRGSFRMIRGGPRRLRRNKEDEEEEEEEQKGAE